MSDVPPVQVPTAPDGYDAAYGAKLWSLLPALYRNADSTTFGQAGPLQELLNRVASQMAVVRRSIDRLWEDQSVESCDDWVVAYIADLLATNLVASMDARGQRLDVANTIDYRRRKGTVGLIEQLSADITGWDARAVEMFRRMSRRRHLLDPPIGWPSDSTSPVAARQLQRVSGLVGTLSGTPMGGRADLRNAAGAASTDGAFDEYYHRFDARFGQGAVGWYGIPKVAVFLWREASIPVVEVTPVQAFNCPDHYGFDPTGRQVALWGAQVRNSQSYGENWVSPTAPDMPGPISKLLYDAVAAGHLVPPPPGAYPDATATFYGTGASLSVSQLDAGYPLPEQSVEVWPEVGRFAVPSGTGYVKASYHYGLFAPVGAGPYDRRQPGAVAPADPAPVTQVQVAPPGGTSSLSDALSALGATGTVQVNDGLTSTAISPLGDAANGVSAVTVRATRQLPPVAAVIRLPPSAKPWVIYGTAGPLGPDNQPSAVLRLEGLLFSGQDIVLRGGFSEVTLSCCTIDPGSSGDLLSPPVVWADAVDQEPLVASRIWVEGEVETLVVDRCILGPLRTRAGGAVQAITATSSIIQGLPSDLGGTFESTGEIFDPIGLLGLIKAGHGALAAYLSTQLAVPAAVATSADVLAMLNNVVAGPIVWTSARFSGVRLRPSTMAAASSPPPSGPELVALNRRLLAEAFPLALADAAISLEQGVVSLSRCTVLGDAHVHRLNASESVLSGYFFVEDTQDGCVRFSAWEEESVLPRRYESVEVPSGSPLFVSQRYGEAAYAELCPNVDVFIASPSPPPVPSILTGAEGGSEMGAFCSALAPVKERSLLIKYAEYMPVGTVPVLVHVPGPDPDGEKGKSTPMATDLARLSYDPGRLYTGVLAQQGRVSLEAEENEALTIGLTERRAELVDIVGPCGTPDDGYAVTQGSGYDIIIGEGTMYVGGNRLTLAAPLDYASQPDWLDGPDNADGWWTPVPTEVPGANEWVVLVVTERDVTAVEDPVLKDVALGGPDGAARLRLLQRVLRIGTQASTCSAALKGQAQYWLEDQGLSYDPATAELSSLTRLQVQYPGTGAPADPCEPSVTGGYLGAQNQAFRVQVNSVDPDSGNFDLLWGPDDASMLYQVSSDGLTPATLTFLNTPVDEYHQPTVGQAVEVLVDAAQLASSDGTVEGYVSSLTGEALVLTSSYQPSTKTLQLPDAVYLPDASSAPQLYLRAWQGLLTEQPVGVWLTLPGTGIQVQVTAVDNAAVHPGDYWVIAARPATPADVYPARFLREAQPPDGPHMWACPLAVIGWDNSGMTVFDDCRNKFPPLTGITAGGGCCTVTVTPDQAQGVALQGIVDKYTADRTQHVTVCLQPGRYLLERPLLLGRGQSNLTLEGCCGKPVLAAADPSNAAFSEGLIVVFDAGNVTISGLDIDIPLVPAPSAGRSVLDFTQLDESSSVFFEQWDIGIGIHAAQTGGLTVSNCTFRYPLSVELDGGQQRAFERGSRLFEVGVLAQGELTGLTLEDNTFASAERLFVMTDIVPDQLENVGTGILDSLIVLAGYLQVPTMFRPEPQPSPTPTGAPAPTTTPVPGPGLEPSDVEAAPDSNENAAGDAEPAPGETGPSAEGTPGGTEVTGGTEAAPEEVAPKQSILARVLHRLPGFGPHAVAESPIEFVRSLVSDAVIKDNLFQGLTLPVFAVGDFGRVEIVGNVVRQCYAGVALLSAGALAAVDLLNAYVARAPADAREMLLSTAAPLMSPEVTLGSVLGRNVPMPAGYTMSKRQTSVQRTALLSGGTQHAGTGEWARSFLTTSFQRTFGEVTDTTQVGLKSVNVALSQFDQAAALQQAADQLDLTFAGNDIDCSAGLKTRSGTPLLVWDLSELLARDGTGPSPSPAPTPAPAQGGGETAAGGYTAATGNRLTASAIVNASRLVASGSDVANLLGVPLVTATANIVVNTSGETSLRVAGRPVNAAITGNVLHGEPLLPPRPNLAAPLDTWLPFNEVY